MSIGNCIKFMAIQVGLWWRRESAWGVIPYWALSLDGIAFRLLQGIWTWLTKILGGAKTRRPRL